MPSNGSGPLSLEGCRNAKHAGRNRRMARRGTVFEGTRGRAIRGRLREGAGIASTARLTTTLLRRTATANGFLNRWSLDPPLDCRRGCQQPHRAPSRARNLRCEMRRRTAAQTAAINIRLRKRENETCRGRMRVPFPVDVGDDGLRDAYAAADMNRLALGPHGTHFVAR